MKKTILESQNFFEYFADKINNPKKLKEFEKAVNKAYDLTNDPDVIFMALKVIAIAKRNNSGLADKANIDRKSLYNMFKKGANPTFKTFSSVSKTLGVNIHLSFAA
jgi:probable addiction module antidote protein